MSKRDIQVNVSFTEDEYQKLDSNLSRNFPDAPKAMGVRIFCLLGERMMRQEPGRVMQMLLDINQDQDQVQDGD